jgi:hypothetical protein
LVQILKILMTDENPNEIDEETEEGKEIKVTSLLGDQDDTPGKSEDNIDDGAEEKLITVPEPIGNLDDSPKITGEENPPQSTVPETSVENLDLQTNPDLVLKTDEHMSRIEEKEEEQVAIVEPDSISEISSLTTIKSDTFPPLGAVPEVTNAPARIHAGIATEGHLNTIDEENEEVDEPAEPVRENQRMSHPSRRDNDPVRTVQEPTNGSRKQCIVCADYITNNHRGIQPCPCGYWVHNHCLLVGIQSYEADHPGCAPLGCRFCMVAYNITPRKGMKIRFMSKIYQRYGQLCDLGNYVVTTVYVDSTFTVVGFFVLMKVCLSKLGVLFYDHRGS